MISILVNKIGRFFHPIKCPSFTRQTNHDVDIVTRSLPEVSETDELDEEDEMYDEFDSAGGGGGGGDCCGCSKSGNNWSQPPGNPAGNLSGKLLLDDLLMINHDRDLLI